jgi:lysophospholipase L1-like esterase
MVLRRILRQVAIVVKWIVVGAICVEVLSFLVVSTTNFILRGHAREGSRAVYDAYALFLQASGVRPTANNSVSPDRKMNRSIWMLGGSTTRGDTDFDDRSIPSFLSKYLNSNNEGLHFAVTNFGTNSFNSLLETKYLQKLLIENLPAPDIIVFYDGANDANYFLEHRNAYAHHGYRRTRALIESYYHSWFGLLKPLNAALYASFSKELYDKIHLIAVPLDSGSPQLRAMVDFTQKRYDFVDKICGCYGAKFILFWQPILWVEECQAPPAVKEREKNLLVDAYRFESLRRNFTTVYTSLAQPLAGKHYFVNLRNVFCDRQVPVYKADGVHLNDDGRGIVAKAIGKVLEQRFFK